MPRRLAFFSPFHSLRIKKFKQKNPPTPPKGFPLLELPQIPLKNVINLWDFIDIIHLSLTSTEFKRALEYAKFDVDQLHFHLGKWYKNIVITHQGQELEIETHYREGGYGKPLMKLNGVPTPMHFSQRHFMKVFVESEESKMDVMDNITRHLLSILHVQKFTATCHLEYDFENLFIWKYTRKLDKLDIEPMENSEIVLSPRELHFLLEDIEVNKLALNVKGENGYKYQDFPLKSTYIDSHIADWIDFDKFTIGRDCVKVNMGYRYSSELLVSETSVNRLLKEWIAGKFEKLEDLCLRLKHMNEQNEEELFNGINTTPNTLSKKHLDSQRIWTYSCCGMSLLQIKRSTDGRLGTIGRHKCYMHFYAWHPKHYEGLEEEPVVEALPDEESGGEGPSARRM